MRFADVFIRRPVFATMLIASLVVLGLFSYRGLGLDLFPNIDFPIVTVTTTLKGASVEEMETGVTKVIEEAVNTIDGIDELRSITKEGLSSLVVQFVLEKPRDIAAQDVRDKVAGVLAQLPVGTDPPVIEKFDVDAVPVMGIAISGRRNLREVTELARKQVKEDIEMRVIRDQSRFIKASLETVRLHLWLGAALVAFTVLLFMRDWRSTLVAGIAIPTSIVSTFTFMRYMGFTLNNLTMLGLVLAVGIVIDDAVVVLENIFRHVAEEDAPPMRAASEATAEIALAVMATTLSLVIIFLPVAFMAGRVGRFFHSFGLTVAVAIMISLLISFTLTPALSARVLRRLPPERAHGGRLYRLFEAAYGRLLAWSLRHRWVIVLLALGTVLSTVPLIHVVGKTFLPQDDQSEFEIDVQTPGGFTLAESSRVFGEIEHHVRSLRGVTDVLTTIGDQTGRVKPGEGDVTTGSIYVRLKDLRERPFSQFDVMADAR